MAVDVVAFCGVCVFFACLFVKRLACWCVALLCMCGVCAWCVWRAVCAVSVASRLCERSDRLLGGERVHACAHVARRVVVWTVCLM